MIAGLQKKVVVLAGMLVILGAFSRPAASACAVEPTVWLDENTASTHVIASRPYVMTREISALARIQQVVVMVTVDRQGNICQATAAAGPMKLRQAAERIVKNHWRFRPFLVDWKPAVAQFPVTVNFVFSAGNRNPPLTAETEPLWQDHRHRPVLDLESA